MGQRSKVRFTSRGSECVGWHYPSRTGGCVIMAAGTAVTKEPGTDRFAAAFAAAGFGVLAFDFRRLGESGGSPRQTVRVADQRHDWAAAISFAAGLPDVDPSRLALWGFSLAGGEVIEVAVTHPELAAVIAQTPLLDGAAVTRQALRHTTPAAVLKLAGLGIVDLLGGWVGRAPRLVPLAGPGGTVSVLSTPDSLDGDRALNPGHRYPDWPQLLAARSALPLGSYRPGRVVKRVSVPLLVVVCEEDQSVLTEPGLRAVRQAPCAELVSVPGGHYAPFLEAYEQVVAAEVSFLRRHLGDESWSAEAEERGSKPRRTGSIV